MKRRGTAIGVAGVIFVLVALLVLAHPQVDPYHRKALDPRSTGPQGLAALVALTRQLGAQVVSGGLPTPQDQIVFEAAATLSGSPESQLAKWVSAGGTLVEADPTSPLAAPLVEPDAVNLGGPEDAGRGFCDVDAMAKVTELGIAVPRVLAERPGDSWCFSSAAGAAMVVHRHGAGLVVTISEVDPFENENLGKGDDAALAADLLAPTPGMHLRVLDANEFYSGANVGSGDAFSALPTRGRQAAWGLVVAFLVWGLARGRRLGKPVAEELPANVPASDLVLAIGEMLGRGDDIAAVAERLRHQSRRRLGLAIGIGADPDPRTLVVAVADHVSPDQATLNRALLDPVVDVAGLLAMSRQLDLLQEELHVSTTH